MLRGTPIILYGDELGVKSTIINNTIVQPYMQWNSKINCGFTTNNSVNVNSNCNSSVQLNTAHGSGYTEHDLFTHLVKLRLKESFLFGKNLILNETNVFAFTRTAEGFASYLVVAHFNTLNNGAHLINFNETYGTPLNAVVEYYYSLDDLINNDFLVGNNVTTDRILLKYGQILILELITKKIN